MKVFILAISITGSFLGMEAASWFIHKYIMHGPLWNIHKSHHQHNEHAIESNDVFTLFFAAIAIVLLFIGLDKNNMWLAGSGIGVSLYGIVYFVLHDIFIHKRIRLFKRSKHPVLNALAEAHRDHHKSREKHPATSFGLLLVNKKYYQQHYRKRKNT